MIRIALFAYALLLAVPTSLAKPPSPPTTARNEPASRYRHVIEQYESLPASEREAWLRWLLTTRLEAACRTTMDRDNYQRVVERDREIVDRVGAGHKLSRDGLRKILVQIDRQQQAAIRHLTDEYRTVTHQAVGTNRWLYQQRMKLWHAIKRLGDASPYTFESQDKLIGWLQAAIMEQRLSGRPPMPPTPDFGALADRPWRAAAFTGAPEVKTSLEFSATQLTANQLEPRIARYNASMGNLVGDLYGPRVLDVEQLNDVVDQIARLGLTRVGLASNALALAPEDRQRTTKIAALDDAIALARVKVSAKRRQVRRQAGDDTTSPQWHELEGLDRIATRLDKLASGPDR